MASIRDLDDIQTAIATLRSARDIINANLVDGISSNLYDWVEGTDITIERAEAAYQRLSR